MWISPETVARIRVIVERWDVRLVWLTTWGRDAADVLAPQIRLPRADVLVRPDDGSRTAARPGEALARPWWKAVAGRDLLVRQQPRALVWTDDDIDGGVRDDLLQLWPHPQLLIAPAASVGMTTRDLDEVEAFMREHHQR